MADKRYFVKTLQRVDILAEPKDDADKIFALAKDSNVFLKKDTDHEGWFYIFAPVGFDGYCRIKDIKYEVIK